MAGSSRWMGGALTLSSFDGWICSMSRWTIFSSLSHWERERRQGSAH